MSREKLVIEKVLNYRLKKQLTQRLERLISTEMIGESTQNQVGRAKSRAEFATKKNVQNIVIEPIQNQYDMDRRYYSSKVDD